MAGYCHNSADNAFGPFVHGCHGADFTLLFEQSILSIGPSALLLCVAPLRALKLRQKPIKVLRRHGLLSKLIVFVALTAVQLACLIEWALKSHIGTRVTIAAAVLSLVSSIALGVLSHAEHTRCVQPSAVINVYLAISILLDIPQARTLFNRRIPDSITALFVTAMALKAVALVMEAQNKRRILQAPYKTYSPEALSGIINRTFQWWINPLFIKGFSNLLSVEQLFPSDQQLTSKALFFKTSKLWPKLRSKSKKHPLRRLLVMQLKYQFVLVMIPRICLIAFKFCQPLLINRITTILSSNGPDPPYNQYIIAATALIYIGLALCTSLYKVQISRTKTMIRGILINLIFDGTIEARFAAADDKAPLSLMTNDVQRINTYVGQVFDGFIGSLIEVVVALIFLEREIGWICVVPILLSIVSSIWGFWNTGAAAPLQRAWVTATQKRVSYTAKILGFPKAMKMLGLTDIFREQIQEHRFRETELSKPMTRFGVLRNTIGHMPQLYAPPTTLAIAVLVQESGYLDVTKAFTTLSIIALLTGPVENLVQSIPMVGSAKACLDRVEEFLLKTEDSTASAPVSSTQKEDGVEMMYMPSFARSSAAAVIDFKEAAIAYSPGETVLHNISTTINRNTLNIIYGPVGCGKSTFLKAILRDADVTSGSRMILPSAMSYCAQDSWLPNLTIRDIILMEAESDSKWYDTVVEACSLSPDIRRMPDNDQTIVGSKGVQLSGGQRQRLALARALYARNEVLVADDILSGLDAVTSMRVFDRVFGPSGLCKQYKMTVVLATHNKQFGSRADNILMLGPNGSIITQGPYNYVKESLQASTLFTDSSAVEVEDVAEDAAPKYTVKVAISDVQQDRTRKTGDLSLYVYYFKIIGVMRGFCFILPACAFTFCLSFPSVWLKWWAEEATTDRSKDALYIGVYFLFAVGSTVLGGVSMLYFTSALVPLTGVQLHRQLLNAVLDAPYSYFTSIDTGVILNRFSQDMVQIDASLSGAAWMTIMFVLAALMEGALIVSGSVYLLSMVPALLIVLYGIQFIYLRTSRQLRYLDLETQAPLHTHFLESIDGLATIRAFGWQAKARLKGFKLLDTSQRPFYLLLCAQVWLSLVLDLVVAGVAVIIVTIAMNLERSTSAASIGVSMIGILSFNSTLTNLIQAWTNMETSLGAVARVRSFEASIESEDERIVDEIQPPLDWPSGRITFSNVSARYNATSEPVLDNFNLDIKPGEKIGICGRSGSGKSSVLLALFRMLSISSGKVLIDGMDINHMHCKAFRSHLNVVPQEPVLLPGSLRFNIDPFGQASDETIASALTKVGLWSILQNREGGLDAPLEQASLSVGQQQLVSVARALLRKTQILVLDEVTSSVDSVTESTITQVIHNDFKDCTVIAVAHRVKTLKDFDRIVVLDSGKVIEVGRPIDLLATQLSVFRGMFERSS